MTDKEARITVVVNMLKNAMGTPEAARKAAKEYNLDTAFIGDALVGASKAKRRLQRLLEEEAGR